MNADVITLNEQMTEDFVDNLPLSIYMTVESSVSPLRIVKLFTKSGWSWRSCSWDEYEVEAENVGELIITSSKPILISGGVATDQSAIEIIEAILDNGAIKYEFDLFNKDDTIIRSRNSDPHSA